jgi:hypothetical protein
LNHNSTAPATLVLTSSVGSTTAVVALAGGGPDPASLVISVWGSTPAKTRTSSMSPDHQ